MNQYTKGEWEAMRNNTVIEKGVWPITGEHYTQKIADVFGQTESFQRRNTLLIAAAPDMYEALQLVNQWRNDPEMFIEEIAPIIKKALAKAEGKA